MIITLFSLHKIFLYSLNTKIKRCGEEYKKGTSSTRVSYDLVYGESLKIWKGDLEEIMIPLVLLHHQIVGSYPSKLHLKEEMRPYYEELLKHFDDQHISFFGVSKKSQSCNM